MARGAKATKGHGDMNGAIAIDPKSPGPDPGGHAMRPAQITRPDRAGQTKGRGIGQRDGLILIIEGDGGDDGAEDFLTRWPCVIG